MNKVELQKLMKKVDKTKKPKHWRKFINNNVIEHNLILKCGNRAFCTHCQKYFNKIVKRNEKSKCQWCEKEYYVSNCNIKNFSFIKDIAFYTKMDNQIFLRVFEIESKYDCKSKKFKHHLQEFARFMLGYGIAINDTVSFYMWGRKVWHNEKSMPLQWHFYTGNKLLYKMPIYPYHKKRIFKDTPIEYAPIKEFKKEYPYYNYFEILQLANYESFELLWKMGLHRLSLYSKKFNKKGSFSKRFDVPKSFLKFMVENDISYKDYRILRLIQQCNMDLIEQYRQFDYDYLVLMKKHDLIKNLNVLKKFKNYYYYSALKTIGKYVSIKKILEYKKGIENIHLYADYLDMANKLNYSIKSKKRLFPKQLKTRHDELSEKIKITEDIETQCGVYKRYLQLSKYTFEDNKYIIFPGVSVDDMKQEGEQQHNCVATNYLIPYIKKQTEIYFIRKLEDLTKSFITLEYKNGFVRQKELAKHNKDFSQEQLDFIDKWVSFRKFINHKDKYKIKTRKNDNKLVA